MSYANYMGQNPFYQQYQMYPNHFVQAMQQTYGQPQQQQNQQQITTQPPILQPQNNLNSRIIPVSNREEATGTPIDLVNGVPTFFYNKGKNEVYLKQFDVPSGTAVFKTYIETQKIEDVVPPQEDNNYQKELHYICEGIDNLHRMVAKLQQDKVSDCIDTETEIVETKSKKRGQ